MTRYLLSPSATPSTPLSLSSHTHTHTPVTPLHLFRVSGCAAEEGSSQPFTPFVPFIHVSTSAPAASSTEWTPKDQEGLSSVCFCLYLFGLYGEGHSEANQAVHRSTTVQTGGQTVCVFVCVRDRQQKYFWKCQLLPGRPLCFQMPLSCLLMCVA